MSNFDASDKMVKRAEGKLAHLVTEINRYIDNNITLIKEVHPEFSYIGYLARIKDVVPDDIGLEIVEAVWHLRGALDKMVADLVIANGKGASGAAFPFGGMGEDGKPEIFPTGRHEGIKKKLTPDQWSLVLAQEPYPGGDDTLWAINTIANAAKHGVGLVTIDPNVQGTPQIISLRCRKDRDGTIYKFDGKFDPKTKIIDLFKVVDVEQIEVDIKIAPQVVFSEIAPVASKNVLTTLDTQIGITKQILKIFS